MRPALLLSFLLCSLSTFTLGFFMASRQSAGSAGPAQPIPKRRAAEVLAEIEKAPPADLLVQTRTWQTLAESTAEEDLPAVVRSILAQPASSFPNQISSLFLRRWAEVDPHAALAELSSSPRKNEWHIATVVGGWVSYDPEAVGTWARTQPAGPARRSANSAYLRYLTPLDPERAFALALEIMDPDDAWFQPLPQIFSMLAAKDPLAALSRTEIVPAAVRQACRDAVLFAWAKSDPEAVIALAAGLPAKERDRALQTALNGWADRDPPAAAAYFTRSGLMARLPYGARNIATKWAELDRRAAVAWVLQLPNTEAQNSAFSVLAESLSDDPRQDMIDLAGMRDARMRESHTSRLLTHWGNRDPSAALDFARQLDDPERRESALASVLGSWRDPREALDHLPDFRSAEKRMQTGSSLVGRLAARDPEGALAFARSQPDEFERIAMLAGAASGLSQESPETAARFADLLPMGTAHEYTRRGIALRLAQNDPAAALLWVQKWPAGAMKTGGLHTVLLQMVKTDAAGARAASGEMPPGRLRDEVIGALTAATRRTADEEVQIGSNSVFTMIGGDTPAGSPRAVIRQVTKAEIEADPRGVLAWAAGLPHPGTRDAAMTSIVVHVASYAPVTAAALLSNLPFSPQATIPHHDIAISWGRFDPKASAEWTLSIPDARKRALALGDVVAGWSRIDHTGAVGWVDNLSETALRDEALGRIVNVSTDDNPALAASLCERIVDPGRRETAIIAVAHSWIRFDRSAATAWLNRSPIAPARKDEILRLYR